MKSLSVFSALVLFILVGCRSEEPLNLEAFNPEAFAFDLGDLWEVNATVRVKGFKQNRDDDTKIYSASVFYSVDLEKPSGEVRENVFKFLRDASNNEPIMDIGLDAQFELGADYEVGTYKLIFKIKDEFSDMQTNSTVEFELQK